MLSLPYSIGFLYPSFVQVHWAHCQSGNHYCYRCYCCCLFRWSPLSSLSTDYSAVSRLRMRACVCNQVHCSFCSAPDLSHHPRLKVSEFPRPPSTVLGETQMWTAPASFVLCPHLTYFSQHWPRVNTLGYTHLHVHLTTHKEKSAYCLQDTWYIRSEQARHNIMRRCCLSKSWDDRWSAGRLSWNGDLRSQLHCGGLQWVNCHNQIFVF